MAGTVTITEVKHTSVKKIIFDWVSDAAAGNASNTTSFPYDGKILALVTIPSGGGTAPTDNYDIAITDADSIDVLVAGGQNRDTANTELVAEASLGAVAGSKLTFAVTNAGNSKQGRAILYLR